MRNKTVGIFALLLLLLLLLSACGEPAQTSGTPPPEAGGQTPAAPEPGAASADPEETLALTSESNRIVNIGTFSAAAEPPIFITSAGQSADASMLDALMKKLGAEFTFNATAAAEDIAAAKTLIVCSGASSKGLGAAGISADDEKARADAVLKAADANGATIIVAHLGGTARRGQLSDEFTDMCLPYADYILVVDEGNDDGKFSGYAEANNVPITVIYAIADALTPLKEIFG